MTENTNNQNDETVDPTTGEISQRNPDALPEEVLGRLDSFDAVKELFDTTGTELEDFSSYGSGFDLLEDKAQLIGVPFVIVEWRWNHSKTYDQPFASIHLMTEGGDKFIINDGSVKKGIAPQLRTVQNARRTAGNVENSQRGLLVRNGLSRSDYPANGKPGDPDYRPAGTTYFLDSSPKKK